MGISLQGGQNLYFSSVVLAAGLHLFHCSPQLNPTPKKTSYIADPTLATTTDEGPATDTQQAGGAAQSGVLQVGGEVIEVLETDLKSAGLSSLETGAVIASADTELQAANTIAIQTSAGLHLTGADAKPMLYAGPAITKGAVLGLKGIPKAKRVLIVGVIGDSTTDSLNGRMTDFSDEDVASLASNMVSSAVGQLAAGGMRDQAKAGATIITEKAIGALSKTGLAADKTVSVSQAMVSGSISQLGTVITDQNEIVDAIGAVTEKSVEAYTLNGFDSELASEAMGSITAASVSSLGKVGLTSDSLVSAVGEINRRSVIGLSKTSLKQTHFKATVKKITASAMASLKSGITDESTLKEASSVVAAGVVKGIAGAGEDLSADDIVSEVMSTAMENVAATGLTEDVIATEIVDKIADKTIASVGEVGVEDSTQRQVLVKAVVNGTVKSLDKAVKDASKLQAAVSRFSGSVTKALHQTGAAEDEIASLATDVASETIKVSGEVFEDDDVVDAVAGDVESSVSTGLGDLKDSGHISETTYSTEKVKLEQEAQTAVTRAKTVSQSGTSNTVSAPTADISDTSAIADIANSVAVPTPTPSVTPMPTPNVTPTPTPTATPTSTPNPLPESGSVAYSSTTLAESGDSGAISQTVTMVLSSDTFAVDQFVSGTHFTGQSVPQGMSLSLAKVTDTVVTLSFVGSATSHTDAADITVGFSWLAAAFTSGDLPASGATADIQLDFNDPPALICDSGTYADTCLIVSSQTVATSATVTIAGDLIIESGATIDTAAGIGLSLDVGGDLKVKNGSVLRGNLGPITADNLLVENATVVSNTQVGDVALIAPADLDTVADIPNLNMTNLPMGAAGGGTYTMRPGGNGGGVVSLRSTAVIQNNGTIEARGGNGPGGSCENNISEVCSAYQAPGGGAGGTIFVGADTISGSGSFDVSGGNGGAYSSYRGGGGSAGRMGFYFGSNTFSGSTLAAGGSGYHNNSLKYGSSGSIFVRNINDALGVASVKLGSGASIDSTFFTSIASVADEVAIDADATIRFTSPETITYSGRLTVEGKLIGADNFQELTLNIDHLIVAAGAEIDGSVVLINSDVVEVYGSISADGRGYLGAMAADGAGPGGGTRPTIGSLYKGGGGGAHVGSGGSGYGGFAGGAAYANIDATLPVPTNWFDHAGSAGGAGYSQAPGGSGGGVIRIAATSNVQIDGAVSSDGELKDSLCFYDGEDSCIRYLSGGGAGGSVRIETPVLSGTGEITAVGGAGSTYSVYKGGRGLWGYRLTPC